MARVLQPGCRRLAVLLFVAALPGGAGARAGSAPGAAPAAHASHPFDAHVGEASRRFGIPADWIRRVMHAESRGNPRAVSHAGAMGLMQVMPGTWAMLTARYKLGPDPFDERANILAGTAYLRQMWDRYGDIELMLAGYNAGPGRADAYAAGRRALPRETIEYVAQIAPAIARGAPARGQDSKRAGAVDWRSARLFASPPSSGSAGEVVPPESASTPQLAAPALFVFLSGRGE